MEPNIEGAPLKIERWKKTMSEYKILDVFYLCCFIPKHLFRKTP